MKNIYFVLGALAAFFTFINRGGKSHSVRFIHFRTNGSVRGSPKKSACVFDKTKQITQSKSAVHSTKTGCYVWRLHKKSSQQWKLLTTRRLWLTIVARRNIWNARFQNKGPHDWIICPRKEIGIIIVLYVLRSSFLLIFTPW